MPTFVAQRILVPLAVLAPLCIPRLTASQEPASQPHACAEPLCVAPEDVAGMARTNEQLASCVGAEDMTDAVTGLRIAAVSVASWDPDGVSLRVVLANVLPVAMMAYPSISLRVDSGNGQPEEPIAWSFYGIPGCTSEEATVTVEWDGAAPLLLTLGATDLHGSATADEVSVVLRRP